MVVHRSNLSGTRICLAKVINDNQAKVEDKRFQRAYRQKPTSFVQLGFAHIWKLLSASGRPLDALHGVYWQDGRRLHGSLDQDKRRQAHKSTFSRRRAGVRAKHKPGAEGHPIGELAWRPEAGLRRDDTSNR
jgi:hypothetical protein